MQRLPASCLAVVLVVLVAQASRAAVEDVGRVEFATGGVSVKGTDVPVLKPGTPLQSGDIVKTNVTSAARITLAGGASVLMQADSELRVVKHDAAAAQTTIELLRGHVLAQSAPDARDTSELRIETPTAIVSTKDGSVVVRTTPDPISLGIMTMSVKVSNGAAPVANAPIIVVVQGVNEVIPVGRTNAQGDAEVALDYVLAGKRDRLLPLPLIEYLPFIKQDFQTVAETCEDGRIEVFLVGEGGKLPDEPRRCRRQRMSGAFVWNGRKRAAIDLGARTLKAADVPVERADRTAVGATIVTSFDRHVAVRDKSPASSVETFLLPGRTAAVDRDAVASPAVRFDHPQLLQASGLLNPDREQWIVPAVLTDFTPAGKPCEPVWIVDGVMARSRARYEIDITGTGTSTGNALQVHVTNEWDCAVYFMVTDGTILHARGLTKRVVTSILTGSIPSMDNFQKMITAGLFMRVPPGAKDATQMMRSYCVELHKLAPHQRTEYQVSGEEDQRFIGWRRPIIDNGFRLEALRKISAASGHTIDSLIQWSLWTQIEGLDQRKFEEEFTKLVRKNYDAQKRRWDDAARKQTAASAGEMWKVIQVIAPKAL